jgi:hypothetical protein
MIPAKRVTEELIAMAGSDRQYYDEDKARNLVEGVVGGFEN